MKEGVKLKRKILKYTMIGVFLFMTFLGIEKVNAEVYSGQAIWPSEHISNIFIRKYRSDGYIKYQQARFMRRSEDNAFVYCLQPFVDIDNNLPYYNIARSDYASILNISEEQWNRIALLAYYGYQYNENGYDHTNKKWYAITQVMIWRTIEPQNKFVFTDTLNGNDLSDKFADEIAEMDSLVNNHYTRPNFNAENLNIPLGQSKTLTDSNDVLKYFSIASTENVTAKIEGNNLIITATGIGDAKVNLVKKATKHSAPPIVYFKEGSQNVMRVGYYDPLPALFNLKVIGGRVEINKKDSDTKNSYPQGNASLENAIYGIYNTSDEKIGELKTDANGYAISDYLPSLGEFYIKEITPSKGYTLDKNKYSFVLNENVLLESLDVYEKVKETDLTIFKVFANSKTGILTPEPNVTFEIFLNNCTPRFLKSKSNKKQMSNNVCYIDKITTDKNGYAEIKLPYGSYTFKQITSTPNYEKVDDFEFVVGDDTDSNTYKLISNAEITAKLKVIKVDKDTGEVIPRSGITFKIKSLASNDYVCQTVTYPKAETLCEFKTDDNGVLITPYPLISGKYKLEEVDQVIDGYLWNKESKEFEIGENSNLITDNKYGVLFETKFENQAVKGKIEINKKGEKFVIDDNKYSYEEIPLEKVKYGLYDENKKLIAEVTTDSNGYAKIENLKLGKYFLKELETNSNHVIDSKEYEVELKYKDQYTAVISKVFNFTNKLSKGKLEFTKKDFTTSDTIPNTKIEIYLNDDEEKLIGEYVTDKDGKVIIDNLPVGHKYFILEKEAPEGYILNTEKIEFEIKENGEIVKSEMTNTKIKSKLIINKVDSNNNPLAGVVIGIYDLNDNLLGEYTTDENGILEVELEYGSYYYKEISTLEHYVLNNDKNYFKVEKDGETINSTLVNDLEEVEVPNTNLNRNYTKYIISLSIGLVGLGIILYEKKKRK